MKTIFFIILIFGIAQALPIVDKRPDPYLYKNPNLPWVMRDSLEFLANSLRDRFENLKFNAEPSQPRIDYDPIRYDEPMVAFQPMVVQPRRPIGTRQYDVESFMDSPWN